MWVKGLGHSRTMGMNPTVDMEACIIVCSLAWYRPGDGLITTEKGLVSFYIVISKVCAIQMAKP